MIVADDSLIVEAIALGLRKSGEFTVVAQVEARSENVETVADASPDVVLIDDPEHHDRLLDLVREITDACESASVIMLTLSPDAARLDAIFDAGAVGAVSKAAHPSALATLIRETVDGRVLHLHRPVGSTPAPAVKPTTSEDSALSARELEVLRLVAAGSTNSEIAQKLWVTEQTVKFHLSNIYRKLEVANRTEASHYAHVNGLLNAS